MSLVQQGSSELRALVDFTGEIVASLDADGDGEISRDEFRNALSKDTLLKSTFIDVGCRQHHPCKRAPSWRALPHRTVACFPHLCRWYRSML